MKAHSLLVRLSAMAVMRLPLFARETRLWLESFVDTCTSSKLLHPFSII